MSGIQINEVYTREEAQELLKISQSTMMRLLKVGTIKAARIGGQYRILGAELLKLFLPDEGYDVARTMYRKSREKICEMEESLKN